MILIDSPDGVSPDSSLEMGDDKSDQSLLFAELDRPQAERRIFDTLNPKLSDISLNRSRQRTRSRTYSKDSGKGRLNLLRNSKPIKFNDEKNALYLSSSNSYNTKNSEEENQKSEADSLLSSNYKRERLRTLEACRDYLNQGSKFNKNLLGYGEEDNSSLPSTVKFVPKNHTTNSKHDMAKTRLRKSNKENLSAGAENFRVGKSLSMVSERAEKESLHEIMQFDMMTEHHRKQSGEDQSYTEFSSDRSIEEKFKRPLYVSMQENVHDDEVSSIQMSLVSPKELLAWEKENTVINVQINPNSLKEHKRSKGIPSSNFSMDENLNFGDITGFAIRTRDLIAREKEMQKLIEEGHYQGHASSKPNPSQIENLLLRKLKMLKYREKHYEKEHKADRKYYHLRSDSNLTGSKYGKVGNVYSIILNPLTEMSSYLVECKKFNWSPSLNESIRTYYNTGFIRVPEESTGYDILLALDYFGISYATHQLSFGSFGCYIRLKAWRNYFNHRSFMAKFILRRLHSSKSRFSYSFFTSSVPSRKTIQFGKNEDCELFEGDLILDSEKEDHVPLSCAVVNRYFNISESHCANGTENQSDETSELMRNEFSSYLQNLLPGTLVKFSIKHISPHPKLSSNDRRVTEKTNTYAVLRIIFGQTKTSKTDKTELQNFSSDIEKRKEDERLSLGRSKKKFSSEITLNSEQSSTTSIDNELASTLHRLEIESRIFRASESTSISSGSVESCIGNKNLNSGLLVDKRQNTVESPAETFPCAQLNEIVDESLHLTSMDQSKQELHQEKSSTDGTMSQRLDEINADWLRDVLITEKEQCVSVCSHYYNCAVDESNKEFLVFNSGSYKAGQ